MEINFSQIAAAIFLLSCSSLTIILCLEKWRAFELYELRRPRSWPPSVCVFCLGFWISYLILGALALRYQVDAIYNICPFASASLTRVLYESSGVNGR